MLIASRPPLDLYSLGQTAMENDFQLVKLLVLTIKTVIPTNVFSHIGNLTNLNFRPDFLAAFPQQCFVKRLAMQLPASRENVKNLVPRTSHDDRQQAIILYDECPGGTANYLHEAKLGQHPIGVKSSLIRPEKKREPPP